MKQLIVTLFALSFTILSNAQQKNFIDQPFIEVSGTADTSVIPDEIYIKIILSEKDTRDNISIEELEATMIKVLESLQINIDSNLSVNDIASNFKSYLLKGKDIIKQKQYMLKVNSALLASKVFVGLEAQNISNTSIDKVDFSDKESLRNLLRERAAENAKQRAEALVKPFKQSVGSAINIIDAQSSPFNPSSGSLNEVVVVGYGVQRKSNPQPELPNIQFQKIYLSASVNLKFILNK